MGDPNWLTTAELAMERGRSRRATADFILKLTTHGVRVAAVKSTHGKPTKLIHRGDYERFVLGLPPANDDDR
jgi:hypothetical protein